MSNNEVSSKKRGLVRDEQRTIAVGLLNNLIAGNKEYIVEHASKNYIQHNPVVADKLEGLLAFMDGVSSVEPKVAINPVRAISEGNLVVVHSEYNYGGPKVLFDLFRFENGQIAEHWDSIQEIPEATVNGNSMTDGATEITNLENTEENKSLAVGFVTDVLMNGKMEMLDSYFGSTYVQHNSQVENGLDGLKKFIGYLAENNIEFVYNTIHKIVAEGNFVYTFSEGIFDGKPTVFNDLFRVESGKIVEHWDIIQETPTEFAHNNGMF